MLLFSLASTPFLIFAMRSFAYRAWHDSCLRAKPSEAVRSAFGAFFTKMFHVERRGKASSLLFTKRGAFSEGPRHA